LLRDGDARNVVDQYRYWTVEAIRADLAARRNPARQLHVAIENWQHDFNIGSIVRTANAFNAAGVHIVGRRHWNRRGAMVTDRYLDVDHHADVAAFLRAVADQRLPIIGIDNVPGAVAMETFQFPPSCVLMFGSESTGLSAETQAACNAIVQITQFGSTRSINAGAAAAIAMWAWSRHGQWCGHW
jgi:tRNA G18 (ribose-2'-O)-methylase SpoU